MSDADERPPAPRSERAGSLSGAPSTPLVVVADALGTTIGELLALADAEGLGPLHRSAMVDGHRRQQLADAWARSRDDDGERFMATADEDGPPHLAPFD